MLDPAYPPWWYRQIPDSELPVGHRAATIYGLLITFQILSWIAVIFRLYCSGAARRGYGLDDLFVIISVLLVTTSTVWTVLGTRWGMGQHYGVVTHSDNRLENWYKLYFNVTLAYFAAGTAIKLSILFQYLRLFNNTNTRRARYWTLGLLFFVSAWGVCFFVIQLFSCSPLSDAWSTNPNANCRWLMSFELRKWLAGVLVHALSNMLLDYCILVIPFCYRQYLPVDRKGHAALVALFCAGGCVATISAVRFILIVVYRGGVHPTQDSSWNAPAFMIPSVLEIQLAVICASVPVFWPILSQTLRLDEIQITREVTLHTESRSLGAKVWKHHSESSETELRDLTANEFRNGSESGVGEDNAYGKAPYPSDWDVVGEKYEKREGNNTAAFSTSRQGKLTTRT